MVLKSLIFLGLITLLISSVACTSTVSESEQKNQEESAPFTQNDAKNLFTLKCASCHGADGKLGVAGAKDLSLTSLSDSEILTIIKDGKNGMPSFSAAFADEQIDGLIAHLKTLHN